MMKGMGEMGVEVRVGALKKIVKQQCTFIRECKGTRAKVVGVVSWFCCFLFMYSTLGYKKDLID